MTANVELQGRCRTCGWPVVVCCVNDGMADTVPYKEWDWWNYCSNPTCEHHVGEGEFQGAPDWVVTH